METKKCKHCQSDIPKKANVCAVCKRKQRHPVLGCTLAIIGVVMIFGALGSSSEPAEPATTPTETTAPQPTKAPVEDSKLLTADKFNAIKFGMSYEDVVAIIGEEGSPTAESSVMDTTMAIYSWQEGIVSCNVTITNGEVTGMAQLGIVEPEATVTLEAFNTIETGMTYDEVVAIIGGNGALLSGSKVLDVETMIYTWNGQSLGSNCNVTMSNGTVMAKAQFLLE